MAGEARYDSTGALDEVVASNASVHLEQLDDGVWWIGLEYADGTVDHVILATARGAKITGYFNGDM